MRTRRKPIPQLDFSNFKETTDILGAKNNIYLRETYGASKNVPLQPVSEPLSPTAALTKAGEDVLKMQKKGYRISFDPNIRPYEIFKDSLVPLLKNQISDKNNDGDEKTKDMSEPFQKFWHSTNFVKRTLKEISRLPFPDEINKLTYQTKFDDSITSLVRQMTQIGLLETKNNGYNNKNADNANTNVNNIDNKCSKTSKTGNSVVSNQDSMVYFITEAKKLRINIFEQAIKSKLFNFNQMNKEFQNEFSHLDSEKHNISSSVHNNHSHNQCITSYQTSPSIANQPPIKKLQLPQVKRSTTTLNRSNIVNYPTNNKNNPSSLSSLDNSNVNGNNKRNMILNQNNNDNNNSSNNNTADNDEDDEDFDRGVLTNAQRYLNLPPSYRPVPSQLSKNAIARQISKNKDIVKKVGTALTEAISDQSKREAKTTPVSPRNSIKEELENIKVKPNVSTKLSHTEVITRPITRSGTPVRNLSPRQNPDNSKISINPNLNKGNRRSLGSSNKLPKLGPKQRDQIYWEDGDPLNTRVGGYVNQINEMHMIAEDFGISNSMERFGEIEEDPLPFKMMSQSNCQNDDTFDADIDGWRATPFDSNNNSNHNKTTTKTISKNDGSFSTASNEHNIKLSQTHNAKSNSSLSRSNYLSTSSARYAYLSASNDNVNKDQQNLNLFLDKMSIEVESDQTGLEIHNRLNEIWDHLGFSFQQKITMALKYSETPEASEKLSDSIKFWESVFSAFDRYDRAYKSFKEYLKMNYNIFENRENVFEQLDRDYRDSQSCLKAANDLLYKNFGDDVVLKRRRANDFMACREAKIQRMKKAVGYVPIE